jgi:hypothetical protein
MMASRSAILVQHHGAHQVLRFALRSGLRRSRARAAGSYAAWRRFWRRGLQYSSPAGWLVFVRCELKKGAARRRDMGFRPNEDEPAVDRRLGQRDDLQHGRRSDG